MGRLSAFWDDERGATAVEYGVMLLILTISIVALTSVYNNINAKFQVATTTLR